MTLSAVRYGLLFALLCPLIGFAQSRITAQLPDQITIDSRWVNIDVGVQNPTDTDLEGYWAISAPEGITPLQQEKSAVRVPAGKKRFATLRLQVSQLALLKDQSVQLSLHTADGTRLLAKTIPLITPTKRDVVLQNQSDIQFFKQAGDSIHIRLQVNNNGTTDEHIRLILTSPNRIGNREFKVIPLSLAAGRDSLVRYSFLVEKYMLSLPQFAVHVAGVYHDDDIFGNVPLTFSNITSSRNYQTLHTDPQQLPVYMQNYIEATMTNGLSQTPNYYLRSQGDYWVAQGKLNYQFNVNQFANLSSRPNISNSFLQYEKKQMGFMLGNIQENTEASVFGRGAKLYLTNEQESNRYTIGAVEKSADLLGFYNGDRSPGFTAFIRTQLAEEHHDRKSYDGLAFYDYSTFDSTSSLLFANTFDIVTPQRQNNMYLRGFVGSGITQYLGNRQTQSHASLAFGLKFNGTTGNWSYDSDNFYSSPYYTGNRRGTLQFNQRISRRVHRSTLGASYQYYRYAPQFANPRFTPMGNSNMRAGLSFSTSFSSLLSLSLQPNYSYESGTFITGNSLTYLRKRAWQLGSTINLRSRNLRHSIFINTDAGLVELTGATVNRFALRSNLSYNIGQFNLYGSFQTGTLQIYELYNSLFFQTPFGNRYTLGASYQGNLFAQKLQWSSSLLTNISQDYGKNYGANLNLHYRFFRNTLLTTRLQYTLSEGNTGYRYAYNNLQLGIRQNLRSPNMDRRPAKHGEIAVFCFYDRNNNQHYDEGDQAATAYTLLINNILFHTDKKGNATFKKVPYGEYQVFFPLKDNYQAVSQTITVQSRKVTVQIPLQQVGTLRGKILIHYDPARSMDSDLSLLHYDVVAKNQEGQLFHTQTNEMGEYTFKLPAGAYEVYLEEVGFPQHIFIQENVRPAHIEIGKVQHISPFKLEVKAKQVEVKRFGV